MRAASLLLASALLTACSGDGGDKTDGSTPTTDADADADMDTDADTDTDTDSDADADADTDTDTDTDTDSGSASRDTGVFWAAFVGEGSADLAARTYTGTYAIRYGIPLTSEFCDIVFVAEDLPSSTVVPSTAASGVNFATCGVGGTPCDFAFDHAAHSPTLFQDCAAFGISPVDVAATTYVFPVGFIDDYYVSNTSVGGILYPYDNLDVLMYYVDDTANRGWYISPFGVVGQAFYGGEEMVFDPVSGDVVFTYYAYYQVIYLN